MRYVSTIAFHYSVDHKRTCDAIVMIRPIITKRTVMIRISSGVLDKRIPLVGFDGIILFDGMVEVLKDFFRNLPHETIIVVVNNAEIFWAKVNPV